MLLAVSMYAAHAQDKLQVVYDGECPFCSSYVKLVRLRDVAGQVELISARDDHPVVRDLLAQNYDLDKGMAVLYEGRIYYGAEAVNFLSAISTPSGLFNRLMKVTFRHRWFADLMYPFLRFGRNAALFFKGSKQLKDHYKERSIS